MRLLVSVHRLVPDKERDECKNSQRMLMKRGETKCININYAGPKMASSLGRHSHHVKLSITHGQKSGEEGRCGSLGMVASASRGGLGCQSNGIMRFKMHTINSCACRVNTSMKDAHVHKPCGKLFAVITRGWMLYIMAVNLLYTNPRHMIEVSTYLSPISCIDWSVETNTRHHHHPSAARGTRSTSPENISQEVMRKNTLSGGCGRMKSPWGRRTVVRESIQLHYQCNTVAHIMIVNKLGLGKLK